MPSVDRKLVPLSEFLNFLEKEKSHGQYLASTERIWALVFVLWPVIGGFFGVILAHTFFMLKFVSPLFLPIFNSSALILMPTRRTVLTGVRIFSTFSSVFIVAGWPRRSSSSTCSVYHWNTPVLHEVSCPYTSHNKLNVSWQFASMSQDIWC